VDVIIDCTLDRFLDGRIVAAQPNAGFRAGHDTVLLAAAVPSGRTVLELGSGAGIASLCYARRVADADVLGVEIDPDLVAIAMDNAARNRLSERVRFSAGDARSLADSATRYDQIFFNPPFHAATGTRSPVDARNEARRDAGSVVAEFMKAALCRVHRGGTITAIIRRDRVDDLLAPAMDNSALVFPLYPRAGIEPKRAIVQIAPGTAGGVRYGAGLVVHRDDGGNTEEAEAILRNAEPLCLA
jgi:tRNA1(Val) A37 N6-methylase TrmN6